MYLLFFRGRTGNRYVEFGENYSALRSEDADACNPICEVISKQVKLEKQRVKCTTKVKTVDRHRIL